jgi:hypothetical protein
MWGLVRGSAGALAITQRIVLSMSSRGDTGLYRRVAAAQRNVENVEKSTPAAIKLWEEAKNVRSNPDSFMGRHAGIARASLVLSAGVLRGVETVGNIAAPGRMAGVVNTAVTRLRRKRES